MDETPANLMLVNLMTGWHRTDAGVTTYNCAFVNEQEVHDPTMHHGDGSTTGSENG
jgi:hypothetical protein